MMINAWMGKGGRARIDERRRSRTIRSSSVLGAADFRAAEVARALMGRQQAISAQVHLSTI